MTDTTPRRARGRPRTKPSPYWGDELKTASSTKDTLTPDTIIQQALDAGTINAGQAQILTRVVKNNTQSPEDLAASLHRYIIGQQS